MNKDDFLLDTHALIFWSNKTTVSAEFIQFCNEKADNEALYVSSISFWETALLARKGRIDIADVHTWKNAIFMNTNLRQIHPTATDMINSALLPWHHKDPFDRLLIAQAQRHQLTIVTRDAIMKNYTVSQIWV
ncbi:MAG: type II toxin-antitoxin system VapC family toxin [Chloroflexota bacterium]